MLPRIKMKLITISLLFLLFSLTVTRSDDFVQKDEVERILARYSRALETLAPPDSGHGENSTQIPKGNDLVRSFVEHFKNLEAATRPLPIPDPMYMPDRVYPISTVKFLTTNVTTSGTSHNRVRNFTYDAVKMKVHLVLRMPKLVLTGNYSYYDWLQKHSFGGFNITLIEALSDCNGKLEVTRDGELAASEVDMDLYSKEQMYMSFKIERGDLRFLVKTFGTTLFNAVKPYFLAIISDYIRRNINDHLKLLKVMFPNSIQP